jgi:hypothetical protein
VKPTGEVLVQWSDALADVLDDHQLGQLAIWKNHEPGWDVSAFVRSDADHEQVQQFVWWVKTALEQLNDTADPLANGWFPSPHRRGRWYMTCALHLLPSPR